MQNALRLKYVTVLLVVSLWLLFPEEARADAIDMGFVAVAGAVVVIPLIAFELFVEAIFLAIGLTVPYRKVLLLSLGANLASLAAGIPVKAFNAWMYALILPYELAPYFRELPRAVFLGAAIYFVVTLLVEFLVVAQWRPKHAVAVGLRRTALVVVLANAATYAVLAPLHYVATRPFHDIREFTDDTCWAQRPVTRIYYVEGDAGNLCSTTTDGQNRRVLVPDTVMDYQFRPEQDWCLYRNGQNHLCLLQAGQKKPQVCWKTDQRFTMEQVACDPNGTIVAYLEQVGDPRPHELVLRDMGSGRVVKTGVRTDKDDWEPGIAWANQPDVLFVGQKAFRVGNDLSVAPVELQPAESNLLVVYGRFNDKHFWSGSDDWGAVFSSDVLEGKEAIAYRGLESLLLVKEEGGSTFVLADNPGLLHLPSRGFGDVCFLGHGQELVFDDHRDIYLLAVPERKVGWIAHGAKVITLTSRHQRRFADGKK